MKITFGASSGSGISAVESTKLQADVGKKCAFSNSALAVSCQSECDCFGIRHENNLKYIGLPELEPDRMERNNQ
jgi:hypothetical protein